MKILLIDATHSFLDFALRCEADGHTVKVFMGPNKDGTRSCVGDGLLHKVDHWESHMNWAELVLTSDNCKYIKALDGFRARGYPILGPTQETAEWELDRECGQRVLQSAGIATIPSLTFSSYDEAAALVKRTRKRYVSKPSGDADRALSYVSKGPHDMCFMLDYWKRQGKIKKMPFLLQEFVPGVEMAVGGWFGRSGFLPYFLENFEFKKLMNDDVGCNTGEMGTALRYVMQENSKLGQEMLCPLEGELYRQGYTGYIDISVIIDEQGCPWPLEFTTRPGWPLFQIQQRLHPEPVTWMCDLVHGSDSFLPLLSVAVGVVVAIPDFPYTTLTKKEVSGFPVWGLEGKVCDSVHPAEMMLGKACCFEGGKIVDRPMLVTAGDYVLIASGVADCVSDAACNAYKIVDTVELPNSPMYRTDIGCRLEKQLPLLQRHGYAECWEY
jgi:phosphoribosylamine--glycine ligase